MRNEQLITELGINPILAVTIMENLDLSTDDINIPQNFAKLQHVINFLKDYSEDAQRFIIRKATFGKQNKLKCMDEYCDLLKEKSSLESNLEKIKKEQSAVGISGHFMQQEVEINNRLNALKEEIEIYHK